MSECAYAHHVGMEKVGRCPHGKCAYAGFVLLVSDYMTYAGTFASEQNAIDFADKEGYLNFIVQPVSMK